MFQHHTTSDMLKHAEIVKDLLEQIEVCSVCVRHFIKQIAFKLNQKIGNKKVLGLIFAVHQKAQISFTTYILYTIAAC
jgi:hypothetical protein